MKPPSVLTWELQKHILTYVLIENIRSENNDHQKQKEGILATEGFKPVVE